MLTLSTLTGPNTAQSQPQKSANQPAEPSQKQTSNTSGSDQPAAAAASPNSSGTVAAQTANGTRPVDPATKAQATDPAPQDKPAGGPVTSPPSSEVTLDQVRSEAEAARNHAVTQSLIESINQPTSKSASEALFDADQTRTQSIEDGVAVTRQIADKAEPEVDVTR
ncbi:hypothetical protein [Actibacterium sp. 188UL27-1]|uniref:hypothetical protein n=1 Tax=Actibacterium sp. 188UL27-1 TaxID=2786961 RepID=UPI001956F7A5|nr:hypothetical protein [Actibacterium sp. 188UL27-1]MBM7068323.1 hypothetical protein [Actibacterium sp. 188UL27-1]